MKWTKALLERADLSKAHQTRRKNKYGAEKVTVGPHTYDSKLEHETHEILKLMERGGELRNVRHHPAAIHLIGNLKFKVDFIAFDVKRGIDIAIDSKGISDLRFQAICQVWPGCGPMPLQIWSRNKTTKRIGLVKEIKGMK